MNIPQTMDILESTINIQQTNNDHTANKQWSYNKQIMKYTTNKQWITNIQWTYIYNKQTNNEFTSTINEHTTNKQ